MAETKCDEQTIEWNAHRAARERVRPDGTIKLYARVYVDVLRVSGNAVTLRVPSRPVAAGPIVPKNVNIVWVESNHDLWMECPSTLASTPGRPPAVGASGYLYLEERFVATNQIDGDPKWPSAFPGPPEVRSLRIFPTKIEITGHELSTTLDNPATFDLLDGTLASQVQSIELDLRTRRVELKLTRDGFALFPAPWPP